MYYFYQKTEYRKIKIPNKEVEVKITIKAFDENEPFDGDIPEDIEAFNRGEFKMIGISVFAEAFGLEGTDHLGMCCYKSDDDITSIVNEYDMIQTAIGELTEQIETIVNKFKTKEQNMDHNIPKLVSNMKELFNEFGSTLILQALANEVSASAEKFKLNGNEKRKIIGDDLQAYSETITKLLLKE